MDKYFEYLIYDKPIPYKNLQIYPALMKDYYRFFYFVGCLTLDKNSIPDVKIITMNYLEYMFYATDEEHPYISLFYALLALVTRNEKIKVDFGYDTNGKPLFKIDSEIYNHEDFEAIREIIVLQNQIELPDESIQKELRDKLDEARRMKAKDNGKMAGLEDQIICVMISTPLKLEDIYQLTIRKFSKILERIDHKLHYQVYLSASLSGMVEFKDKSVLKHWMIDLKKDNKYEDVIIDSQEMKNKIDGANK